MGKVGERHRLPGDVSRCSPDSQGLPEEWLSIVVVAPAVEFDPEALERPRHHVFGTDLAKACERLLGRRDSSVVVVAMPGRETEEEARAGFAPLVPHVIGQIAHVLRELT